MQTQRYFVNFFLSSCISPSLSKCCLIAKVRKSEFILTLYLFVLSFEILRQNLEFEELEHIRIFDVSASQLEEVSFNQLGLFFAPSNLCDPEGAWADPGGRCNTGPTRGRRRASPHDPPGPKNLIISKSPIGLVSEIKLIRTDTTL